MSNLRRSISADNLRAPASSPATLRCPPSGAASTSAARRRLRAATALLTLAEKTAGNPYLPIEEREHALKEAQRHLNAAWFFLVSWSTEDSVDTAAMARAAEMLGEANRRLPLIASNLRGPASVGKEAALCTPPLASFPCAPSARIEASAFLDGSPRRFDPSRPTRPPEHQRPQLHRRHRQERPRLLRHRLPQLHHPRYPRAESENAPSSSRSPRSWGSSWPSFTATQSQRI